MGQNPYGVVRAYAIMVYRHTHLYSTVDGQLASGHNWDPKEIASCSATNNTSFVPWLLDVFSTLMPFSNLKSVVTLPGWSARFFAWWIRHRFWFLLGSQTSRQFWAHPDWRCRAHERCHLTTGYIWLPKSGVLPVPLLCWTSTYLLMAPQSHHNDALEWPRFNQFGTTLNENHHQGFWAVLDWCFHLFILRVCCTNHETLIYYLLYSCTKHLPAAGHAVAAIHLCGCAHWVPKCFGERLENVKQTNTQIWNCIMSLKFLF